MDIVTRSALVLLLPISSHASASDEVIGILDIPSVFNTKPATSANSGDLAPETPSPARRFNLRDKPGLDTRVVSTVAKSDVLANEEFSYEQTGALVYDYKYLKSSVEEVSDTWQEQDWMLVVLFEESPCLSTRQQPRVVAAGWMWV